MHDIGLPIIALLRRMGFGGQIIGRSDQRPIGARIIGKNVGSKLSAGRRGAPRGQTFRRAGKIQGEAGGDASPHRPS